MLKQLSTAIFFLALCFSSIAEDIPILDESVFTLEEDSYRSSLTKSYQGYESCKSEFKGAEYEKATSNCLKSNSSMSEWDCEGIAEEEVDRIVTKESLHERCGYLLPTAYADGVYGAQLPGAAGAIFAIKQRDYQSATKILNECVNVDPINCKTILGIMNYYGVGIPVDRKLGIKLLKAGKKSGSKNAKNLLDKLNET